MKGEWWYGKIIKRKGRKERITNREKNERKKWIKKRRRSALVGQVINLDPFLHLTLFIFLLRLRCCPKLKNLQLLPHVFRSRICQIKVKLLAKIYSAFTEMVGYTAYLSFVLREERESERVVKKMHFVKKKWGKKEFAKYIFRRGIIYSKSKNAVFVSIFSSSSIHQRIWDTRRCTKEL